MIKINKIVRSAICLVAFGLMGLPLTKGQDAVLTSDFQGSLDSRQQSIYNNLNEKPTTKRARLAVLDTSVFNKDNFEANLFADHNPRLQKQDIGRSGVPLRTWTGNFPEVLGSGAFVINGNRISGHVVSTDGNFEIFPLGDEGVHAIVEHDISQFRGCGNEEGNKPTKRLRGGGGGDDGYDNDMGVQSFQEQQRLNDEECFIRVIVGYTALAQTETDDDFGRTMIEHISLAITESNQGYANSDVDMRMEMAHMYLTTDDETNNACNDVDDLQEDGDGKWDEIHDKRGFYDGDMVCLITGGLYAINPACNPNGGLCGRAFGFDYTDDANMFQVSEYDCATGNFTFAHEFGHNQGARHDNDNTGTPFSYARGYNQGSLFRTIMAVCCSPTRVNYWSNPDIDHPSCDCPTGTSTRDNARALDVGDFTVAHHRTTPGTFSTGLVLDDDEWLNMLTSTQLTSTNDAESGSLLQLKSYGTVLLNPGFHAKTGSTGRYYVASTCPGTTYAFTQNDQTVTLVPDADGYVPTQDNGRQASRDRKLDDSNAADGQNSPNEAKRTRQSTEDDAPADGQSTNAKQQKGN